LVLSNFFALGDSVPESARRTSHLSATPRSSPMEERAAKDYTVGTNDNGLGVPRGALAIRTFMQAWLQVYPVLR